MGDGATADQPAAVMAGGGAGVADQPVAATALVVDGTVGAGDHPAAAGAAGGFVAAAAAAAELEAATADGLVVAAADAAARGGGFLADQAATPFPPGGTTPLCVADDGADECTGCTRRCACCIRNCTRAVGGRAEGAVRPGAVPAVDKAALGASGVAALATGPFGNPLSSFSYSATNFWSAGRRAVKRALGVSRRDGHGTHRRGH